MTPTLHLPVGFWPNRQQKGERSKVALWLHTNHDRSEKGMQMLQNSFKSAIVGTAVICLSAGMARESKADVASCASTIPFGLTTALTGNLALLGTQARNGVEFAVDEINANGGIAGKKLVLTTEDTGASSTDALNAMNRIIESKPLIIFGSMISPHVFAQTEGVTKSETPFLVGATNAKVTAQVLQRDMRIQPETAVLVHSRE
jgi:branched-chain amino acid transport system substrate-binding protein